MSSDRPSLKQLWAAQPSEGFAMPVEELRARAEKLHRTVRHRNLREMIAAAFVIMVFGFYVYILPGALFKVGSVLVIAATVFVVWQLLRRATSEPPPLDLPLQDLMAFHRRALERQRDALASVWRWYLAPFVPGLMVFIAAIAVKAPLGPRAIAVAGVMAVIMAAVFVGVWRLNVWGASQLQKRIDALWLH